MRESPSCTVALHRFGVWRAAVAFGTATALAAVAAWTVQSLPSDTEAHAAMVLAMAIVLAVVSAGLGWSLARVEGGVLSGVGGRWTFIPDAASPRDPEPGELVVAIDLGSFVLLSLRVGAGSRARRRWLPVQRRGLERDWHAFRCALYSPPPATLDARVAGEPPF